ncbi:MAG: hypothetical protein LZ174_09175 [Thaumarchaeota archaeon]|jgi:hypothetical protein|nr:hypothetical protein [Candidatus Geocrenenecus arthurdayi]
MNIERLVKRYERDVKRILKASRIYPDMVTRYQIYFATLKALRMFESIGVDVELTLPRGAIHSYIIPREALSIADHIYHSLGLKPSSAYIYESKIYIRYDIDNLVPLYAVTNCIIPDIKSILGDVESFYGIQGYKPENVSRYLLYLLENYRDAQMLLNIRIVEEGLREIPILLRKLEGASAVVRDGIWIYEKAKEKLYQGRLLVEFGSEEFIAEPTDPHPHGEKSLFIHNALRIHGIDYILYSGEFAGKILEECVRKMEEIKEREKRFEGTWRSIMNRRRDHYVEIGLDELRQVLASNGFENSEEIVEVAERYCEKVYLVDELYNNVCYSYVGAGRSYRHPLRLLYLLRILEDRGVQARIATRGFNEESLPRIAVRIDRAVYSRVSEHGIIPSFFIILVPRRDLKVEYRCDVKIEDGYVVSVDLEGLSEALRGDRGVRG